MPKIALFALSGLDQHQLTYNTVLCSLWVFIPRTGSALGVTFFLGYKRVVDLSQTFFSISGLYPGPAPYTIKGHARAAPRYFRCPYEMLHPANNRFWERPKLIGPSKKVHSRLSCEGGIDWFFPHHSRNARLRQHLGRVRHRVLSAHSRTGFDRYSPNRPGAAMQKLSLTHALMLVSAWCFSLPALFPTSRTVD